LPTTPDFVGASLLSAESAPDNCQGWSERSEAKPLERITKKQRALKGRKSERFIAPLQGNGIELSAEGAKYNSQG
jgi:hypothetical protein